jgi:hypothetical protein
VSTVGIGAIGVSDISGPMIGDSDD